MSHYELTYIISANLAETEYPNIQTQVKELISGKLTGAITREMVLGRKKLAYPIKKEKHGYYVTVEFDLEPANIRELDRLLKLDNSLLRHLLITNCAADIQVNTPRATFGIRKKVSGQDSSSTCLDRACLCTPALNLLPLPRRRAVRKHQQEYPR